MTPGTADLIEAASWALEHFEALDQSNACIHMGEVRYSPITMALAVALNDVLPSDPDVQGDRGALGRVLLHRGAYELDTGR